MILVLGNAAIDQTWYLDRLPVDGETVAARRRGQGVGGKGLNQAVMAHRAGMPVLLVAAVGDDADSGTIRDALTHEGLSADGLVTVAAATDRSTVLIGADGRNMIVTDGGAAASLDPDRATAACATLQRSDVLMVQGNLSRATTEAALRCARAKGMLIVANPSPLAFDWAPLFDLVDLLVVNEVEARALDVPQGADHAVAWPIDVLVTQGNQGADLRLGAQRWHVPAPAVEPVDTTGAGDVLIGVFVAAIAQQIEPEPALTWAVAAASAKVVQPGTLAGFPTAAELKTLRR